MNRIVVNSKVWPVTRSTRVPAEFVLRMLGDGASEGDPLDAYPRSTRVDIPAPPRAAPDDCQAGLPAREILVEDQVRPRASQRMLEVALVVLAVMGSLLGGCGKASSSEPAGKGTAQPGGQELRRGAAWTHYETGPVSSLVWDAARNCAWYAGKLRVGQLTLDTGGPVIVAAGISARTLALSGDQVWIGGHEAERGGGLSVYDIPSGSVLTYRVESTQEHGRPGLLRNSLVDILGIRDTLLLAYPGAFEKKNFFTCFRPAEDGHAARWVTHEAEEVRKGRTLSEILEEKERGRIARPRPTPPAEERTLALMPERFFPFGDVVLLSGGGRIQGFDPAKGAFSPIDVFGDSGKVAARTPSGREIQLEIYRNTGCDVRAVDGTRIWFVSWFLCEGRETQVTICHDIQHGTNEALNRAMTESSAGDRDGLWRDCPTRMLVDPERVWFLYNGGGGLGSAAIVAYDRKTREFTQYTTETGCPFRSSAEFWGCADTGDSLLLGTQWGVYRFRKPRTTPRITATKPTAGSRSVRVSEVSATFDAPMNPATINPGSVQLWVNGAIAQGRVSYDAVHHRVILTVTGRVPSGARCEFVIKSLVQGEDGAPVNRTRTAFQAD